MEADELQLVAKAQKGREDAFAELYERYLKQIYNFVYFKTTHKETVEDLVSLVFIKVLENLKNFKIKEKASFKAWIYLIARNTVIDYYRTQKKDKNIDDFWDIGIDNDLNLEIDNKEKIAEIQKYLKDLKPSQREVVILRVWEGLSYKEIAEIVGKSQENAKMIFSRTIRKLKEEMTPEVFLLFLLLNL